MIPLWEALMKKFTVLFTVLLTLSCKTVKPNLKINGYERLKETGTIVFIYNPPVGTDSDDISGITEAEMILGGQLIFRGNLIYYRAKLVDAATSELIATKRGEMD